MNSSKESAASIAIKERKGTPVPFDSVITGHGKLVPSDRPKNKPSRGQKAVRALKI